MTIFSAGFNSNLYCPAFGNEMEPVESLVLIPVSGRLDRSGELMGAHRIRDIYHPSNLSGGITNLDRIFTGNAD